MSDHVDSEEGRRRFIAAFIGGNLSDTSSGTATSSSVTLVDPDDNSQLASTAVTFAYGWSEVSSRDFAPPSGIIPPTNTPMDPYEALTASDDSVVVEVGSASHDSRLPDIEENPSVENQQGDVVENEEDESEGRVTNRVPIPRAENRGPAARRNITSASNLTSDDLHRVLSHAPSAEELIERLQGINVTSPDTTAASRIESGALTEENLALHQEETSVEQTAEMAEENMEQWTLDNHITQLLSLFDKAAKTLTLQTHKDIDFCRRALRMRLVEKMNDLYPASGASVQPTSVEELSPDKQALIDGHITSLIENLDQPVAERFNNVCNDLGLGSNAPDALPLSDDKLRASDTSRSLSASNITNDDAGPSKPAAMSPPAEEAATKENLPPHLRVKAKAAATKDVTKTATKSGTDDASAAKDHSVKGDTDNKAARANTAVYSAAPKGKGKAPAINPEDIQIFAAWPKAEARGGSAAQVRTVTFRNLPPDAKPSFVASLVFGGALECIKMSSASSIDDRSLNHGTSAMVRFLSGADCQAFYDAVTTTKTGGPGRLVYKDQASMQGFVKNVVVEKATMVDVVGGLLQSWIDGGATRCVRAAPVDKKHTRAYLWSVGEGKGRKLEGADDGKHERDPGVRVVVWRFCEIKDAVAFRGELGKNEDFEACNLGFEEDPCVKATGPRV